MAVSKRLRFAVFQRDDHTCQYCGLRAGDQGTVLQIDHILPVSVGGKDEPSNLVTACRDCNAGKSSSVIEAPKVAAPSVDARRWANAIQEAAEERKNTAADEKAACEVFLRNWQWSYPPDDWRPSVAKFVRMGVSVDDVERILLLANDRAYGYEHCWRYFCKVCWSEVDAIRARAGEIMEEEAPEIEVPAPVTKLAPRPVMPEPIALGPVPYCIECDERPATRDGMCPQCITNLYEGLA